MGYWESRSHKSRISSSSYPQSWLVVFMPTSQLCTTKLNTT
jgi:hypothetical protein